VPPDYHFALTLASFTALFRVPKMRKMERKHMMSNTESRNVSRPMIVSRDSDE
jgi:hypothetical protein